METTLKENKHHAIAGTPIGKGCKICGGPICTGHMVREGHKKEVFVCAWCKMVIPRVEE